MSDKSARREPNVEAYSPHCGLDRLANLSSQVRPLRVILVDSAVLRKRALNGRLRLSQFCLGAGSGRHQQRAGERTPSNLQPRILRIRSQRIAQAAFIGVHESEQVAGELLQFQAEDHGFDRTEV